MGWSAGAPFEEFGHGRADPDKPANLSAWGEIRWHASRAWRLIERASYAIRGLLP